MRRRASGFAELAARSHYSFLEGASSPAALAAAAARLEMPALGLCDRNGLYGAVAFVTAAHEQGIRPLLGAELDLVDGDRLRLLVRDGRGYAQLSRAISAAQLAGQKGQPRLRLDLPSLADATSSPAPPTPPRRRRPRVAPPSRSPELRPTAGPFPEGWPGLPSTRSAMSTEPAVVHPHELDHCVVLAGGPQSAITRALLGGDRRGAGQLVARLAEAFGRERVLLLLSHHLHCADEWLVEETARLARDCHLEVVASNLPVHATVDDKPLLDVLTAIRHRTTLDRAAAHGLLLPNAEHRLKSEAELRALLGRHPTAFETASRLALECQVSLDVREVRFPSFPVPDGESPSAYLRRLCREALPHRYPGGGAEVEARLARELAVIEATGLAEFFLVTWDIVRFAREQGIPVQGRGSAADSLVAYLLGITRVDPIAHDLLFERFLHEEYSGTPDIDIDISTDHRERVIQYVYQRYGPERTGMVANVVCFRPRSAIRQVGAALGLPEPLLDRLATAAGRPGGADLREALAAAGLEARVLAESITGARPSVLPPPRSWHLFLELVERIQGTPRHLGIHVGGMLVTGAPLTELAPVERATMQQRLVVQFDKDAVENLGLVKLDLLGLRTLSAIATCLDLVEASTGERPDLDRLALDDPAIYDMICDVDTIGIFQLESRAQQQSLYQSQPRTFDDLVVQVAIIRPGPIQGNAVHPYLRRRQGREPVTYLHPWLEPILADTRGVVLYQEQILRILMEVAGCRAAEAERFRRAMSRHRSPAALRALGDDFVGRCRQRGMAPEVAAQIFAAIAGFAEFGFCKSHAAAFARTAYETAWLRLHHFAAWLCALLQAQPMGFYHPSVLIEDAKRHGVPVLPVDVTRSRAGCTLEWIGDGPPPLAAARAGLAPGWRAEGDRVVPDPARRRPATPGERLAREVAARARDTAALRHPRTGRPWPDSPWAVRLGYRYVRQLGPEGQAACEAASQAGVTSVAEFWCHTGLSRPAVENLVLLGAFDAVAPGRPRRALLWELREAEPGLPRRRRGGSPSGQSRVVVPPLVTAPVPAPELPPMRLRQRTAAEYRITEVSTGHHVVSFLRSHLAACGCLSVAEARRHPHGRRLRLGGLIIARQAPVSAKGFCFATLADETGHLDLVVRPDVAPATRWAVTTHPLVVVEGVLEVVSGRVGLVVTGAAAIDDASVTTAAPAPDHPWPVPPAHDFR